MKHGKWRINRALIALVSVACLGVGGWGQIQFGGEPQWVGFLIRFGLAVGAIWIASARWFGVSGSIEMSPNTLLVVVAILAAIAIRPRFAIPAAVVIFVLWFVVRPRNRKSTVDRSKR